MDKRDPGCRGCGEVKSQQGRVADVQEDWVETGVRGPLGRLKGCHSPVDCPVGLFLGSQSLEIWVLKA